MAVQGGSQRIPRPAGVRAGAPPPWAALAPQARRLDLDEVRSRLALRPPARPPASLRPDSRDAAVLVPLFEEDAQARVILTKRPETMASHRGEIAFPGGKRDPTDPDLRHTALREAYEEIGLDPRTVALVGTLDGIATYASAFTITPFVGLLGDRPALTPDPDEVDAVFDVALADLLDPVAYREERWELGDGELVVHFFELPGETVWGATARILVDFLGHLVDGRDRPGPPQGGPRPAARGA